MPSLEINSGLLLLNVGIASKLPGSDRTSCGTSTSWGFSGWGFSGVGVGAGVGVWASRKTDKNGSMSSEAKQSTGLVAAQSLQVPKMLTGNLHQLNVWRAKLAELANFYR
jgi:hypothetical protein